MSARGIEGLMNIKLSFIALLALAASTASAQDAAIKNHRQMQNVMEGASGHQAKTTPVKVAGNFIDLEYKPKPAASFTSELYIGPTHAAPASAMTSTQKQGTANGAVLGTFLGAGFGILVSILAYHTALAGVLGGGIGLLAGMGLGALIGYLFGSL